MSDRDNAFAELERFFERMSRQFDDASSTWGSQGPLTPWASSGASVALDLVDRDEEFVVTADLPGFDRDDIDVRVTDHTLRIAAERESTVDEDTDRYLRHERRHESIERSIRLPEDVDKDAVTAETNNGVLTVTLPKLEVREARHIEVEGA